MLFYPKVYRFMAAGLAGFPRLCYSYLLSVSGPVPYGPENPFRPFRRTAMTFNLPLVLFLASLLFILLLLSLGFQPKFMNKLLGGIFLFVGISGIFFYGYGFFSLFGGNLVSVMRTLFSVFCMFLGRNEIATISAVPFLQTRGMQILIYLTHLLALYATASTVVTNVGARLIRTLSLLLLYHKKIVLMYGANDNSLRFAEALRKDEKNVCIFVDENGGNELDAKILKMGSILFSGENAARPGPAFLKKIGLKPGKKQLSVFCLDADPVSNLRFAELLQSAIKEAGIAPGQCCITLMAEDEESGAALQHVPGRNESGAYGSVLALQREDLLARLLMREFPPCGTMRFDDTGRAAENFEALLVGFGRTGQAILRALIMQGQFTGSQFHALVIDPAFRDRAGLFCTRYAAMLEAYDVEFREDNARSVSVFRYLEDHILDMNYLVVCTGDEKENAKVAREYADFLRQKGSCARVLQCSHTGITSISDQDRLPCVIQPYVPELLDAVKLDGPAMAINHQYHRAENRSAEEDWAACDYFSRQSCRASADYIPAFLCASGLSREVLAEKGWPDDPVLMENLSCMEHMRWCAFHLAMGYRPMPEEVFEARASAYRQEIKETGSSRIRVAKDSVNRLHACLVSWEQLPALDRKERESTGRLVNYRQLDRDNVLLIPQLLRKGSPDE